MTLWTDVSVGAVYGAMKRLSVEGLLRVVGEEREGMRPTRQLFEITDRGREVLRDLQRAELREIWFRYDPFDLALTTMTSADVAELPTIIDERLSRLRKALAARPQSKTTRLTHDWALRHTEYRLAAEITYLEDLRAAADDIVSDERRRLRTRAR